MNAFGSAPLHKIGQIASHNTNTTSNWTSHLANVNAIELDVWPLHNWIVSHDFDIGAGNLDGYMEDLKNWRASHPNHDLLTVFIEIKSREGWKVGDFESILLRRFNATDLFRPVDLAAFGRAAGYTGLSLRGLVGAKGWPDVTTLRGKVMFVLNGADHVTDTYLAERPVVSGGTWSNASGTTPVCFMMSSQNDARTGFEGIVLFNGEYRQFPDLNTAPADKCLRRAYSVSNGNAEMVSGNVTPASLLMASKWINYLAYDQTENAFWVLLP